MKRWFIGSRQRVSGWGQAAGLAALIVNSGALCVGLLGLPAQSLALGLATLRLSSALNQPLRAVIPLTDVATLQLGDVQAKLASARAFATVGVPRPATLTKLKFTVARLPAINSEQGQLVIRVTTPRPVTQTALKFLLDVSWPEGELIRQYVILLSPPVIAEDTWREPAPLEPMAVKVAKARVQAQALVATKSTVRANATVQAQGAATAKQIVKSKPPAASSSMTEPFSSMIQADARTTQLPLTAHAQTRSGDTLLPESPSLSLPLASDVSAGLSRLPSGVQSVSPSQLNALRNELSITAETAHQAEAANTLLQAKLNEVEMENSQLRELVNQQQLRLTLLTQEDVGRASKAPTQASQPAKINGSAVPQQLGTQATTRQVNRQAPALQSDTPVTMPQADGSPAATQTTKQAGKQRVVSQAAQVSEQTLLETTDQLWHKLALFSAACLALVIITVLIVTGLWRRRQRRLQHQRAEQVAEALSSLDLSQIQQLIDDGERVRAIAALQHFITQADPEQRRAAKALLASLS